MRWMSSDGKWVVALVTLTATGNGRDGDWLRVSHRGFFVGEARDWDGVAGLGVDIADLRETLGRLAEACQARTRLVVGRAYANSPS
jgi:hypothetical protein